MRIEIYGKPGCAKCKTTKNKVSHFMQKWGVGEQVPVSFVDMSTPDGMAEGAFNDVFNIPTTIVRKTEEEELVRWDGVIPPTEGIRELVMAEHG